MAISDIEKLQRTNPELYSAIVEIGVQHGVIIERRRVLAHLQIAIMYDALEEAIRSVSVDMPAYSSNDLTLYENLHHYYANIQDTRLDNYYYEN